MIYYIVKTGKSLTAITGASRTLGSALFLTLLFLTALLPSMTKASELDTHITPGEPFYARIKFPIALTQSGDNFEIATDRAYKMKGLEKPKFLQTASVVRNQSDSRSLYITTRDGVSVEQFDLLLIGNIADNAAFAHFNLDVSSGRTVVQLVSEHIPTLPSASLPSQQPVVQPASTGAPEWNLASVSPINLNPAFTPATLTPDAEAPVQAITNQPTAATSSGQMLVNELVTAIRQQNASQVISANQESSVATALAQNSTILLSSEIGHYKTVTVVLYLFLGAGAFILLYVAIARVVERQGRENSSAAKTQTSSTDANSLNSQLLQLVAMNMRASQPAPANSDSSVRDAWMLEVAQNTRTLMEQVRNLEAQNAELSRRSQVQAAQEAAQPARPRVRMSNVRMDSPQAAPSVASQANRQPAPQAADSEPAKFAETLQLATVYESMGDRNMARTLLQQVVAGGSKAEKAKAENLLAEMG